MAHRFLLFAEVPQIVWWIGGVLALLLIGLVVIFRYFFFVRVPLWFITHIFYRIKAHGVENIPKTGAVLLVSNHVSHIDAGLIVAPQKRKIRFLIWAPFLKVPILGWLLKMAKVIPIRGSSGPRALINSLRTASEALAKGELVCIFAEGGITRTGFLLPFQRGLEQITKRTAVPIVPVCLDHVWGSIFSFQRGKFFWKLPKQFPYRVFVNYGKPLPPGTPASEVRQAIQMLSAESAIRRAKYRKPVHRVFVRNACRHPFRPCFVDPNNKDKPILNYGEALAGAKILAKLLRPKLAQEKMVGLWIPPSAGGAVANVAVALLGKTAVNLNYSIPSPEILQAAIRQCGIRKILTSKLFALKMPLDPGPDVEVIYLEDFRKKISNRQRLFTYLSVLLVPHFIQDRFLLGLHKHSDSDLATVIFSSGSTGEPKGVLLTHSNISANTESVIQAIDPQPKDRLVGILPFFHSFGYTVTLWVPLQVGASTVFHFNPLQAKEIGDMCRTYSATILLTTPTFLRTYIKRCQPEDFKALRLLVTGAEKLPQAVAEEFNKKFGIMPMEGYGCTELSPVAAANVPTFEDDEVRQVGNKPGSIGQCLPGVAGRIVQPDTMETLPPGKEGMLIIFGANVMKGYLGRDDLTKSKVVKGWYVTGDLAIMDEEGFITITGRQERFAKVGGEMVPLEKVEEELHAALGTSERILAVTAIPDTKRGERIIVLYTSLPMAPDELIKQVSQRGLPNIYLPGNRDFFEVKELPVLGSGKLDIKKCKDMAIEAAK